MFICRQCINSKKLNHLDVPNAEWITTHCDICNNPKTECVMTVKEALETQKSKPAKSAPKSKPKKEKYQYLLIDYDDNDPYRFYTTKTELIDAIGVATFQFKHENIDAYKLTPLPHKAEIKVEVSDK